MDTIFLIGLGCVIGYYFSQKKEADGAVLPSSLKEKIKNSVDKL